MPVAKPGVAYDVLYWVGCSASYDRRAQKIARAMVKILKAAGIHFAVMQEERCHGDFARRAGENTSFRQLPPKTSKTSESISSRNSLRPARTALTPLKTSIPSLRAAPLTA